MAAKKKGGVVKVAMVCSECKATNYFTNINKLILKFTWNGKSQV